MYCYTATSPSQVSRSWAEDAEHCYHQIFLLLINAWYGGDRYQLNKRLSPIADMLACISLTALCECKQRNQRFCYYSSSWYAWLELYVSLLTFTMKVRVPFSFCGIMMLCTVKTKRASLDTPEAQERERGLLLGEIRNSCEIWDQFTPKAHCWCTERIWKNLKFGNLQMNLSLV